MRHFLISRRSRAQLLGLAIAAGAALVLGQTGAQAAAVPGKAAIQTGLNLQHAIYETGGQTAKVEQARSRHYWSHRRGHRYFHFYRPYRPCHWERRCYWRHGYRHCRSVRVCGWR